MPEPNYFEFGVTIPSCPAKFLNSIIIVCSIDSFHFEGNPNAFQAICPSDPLSGKISGDKLATEVPMKKSVVKNFYFTSSDSGTCLSRRFSAKRASALCTKKFHYSIFKIHYIPKKAAGIDSRTLSNLPLLKLILRNC